MPLEQRAFAPGPLSRATAVAALVTLLLAAPASADVTMKRKSVSAGLAGFLNGTDERTTVIAGDRSRSDAQSTYTGTFSGLLGGNKPRQRVEIVRLDKQLIWAIDVEKKTYTEMTFAEMKAAMEKGIADAKKEAAKPENQKATKDAQQQNVEVDYKVDVQRTGKKDKVNGFAAEQVIVTITAIPKNKDTGETAGEYTIKIDEWLANDLPGQGETLAFYKRFAEEMGVDAQLQQAAGMMRQYAAAFQHAGEKMKDLKGYPVHSVTTLELGAQLTPEQKAEQDKARAQAEKDRAAAKQKRDEKEDADANASAAGSLAHGNVGGALGGLLGRKISKTAEQGVEQSAKPSSGSTSEGSGVAFTVTTDLLACTTGSSGASFDLPAGLKKVDRKEGAQ